MIYAKHIATFDNSYQKKRSMNQKKASFILFGAPIIPIMAVIGRAYNSITLNEKAQTSE